MGLIILGLGDYGVSNQPGDIIKTFALGSCVGIVMIDPKVRVAGMAHVVLPDSNIDQQKALHKPGYFADTAIPALIKKMKQFGSGDRLIVKLAGGAEVLDTENHFNVGKRNILAVKKILWAHRLAAFAENLGGNMSRTLAIDVAQLKVSLSNPAKGEWEL